MEEKKEINSGGAEERTRSGERTPGGVCEVGARPIFLPPPRRISIALHTIAILRGA